MDHVESGSGQLRTLPKNLGAWNCPKISWYTEVSHSACHIFPAKVHREMIWKGFYKSHLADFSSREVFFWDHFRHVLCYVSSIQGLTGFATWGGLDLPWSFFFFFLDSVWHCICVVLPFCQYTVYILKFLLYFMGKALLSASYSTVLYQSAACLCPKPKSREMSQALSALPDQSESERASERGTEGWAWRKRGCEHFF